MDLHKLNKYQTPITEELQKSLPKEVWEDLLDFVGSVRFIQNLIAPEEVRGFAKDRPRDSKGRIKVDLTNPHIIEDMDYFRERALFFEKNKCYTHLRPNPNPRSEFAEFWKEEKRRWKEGFVRPSDGEWIPGYYYFYLNYTQIWLNEIVEDNGVKKKTERVKKFPKPWLGDYLFFHYYQQAIDNGNHVKILKTRGVGISFKFSALSTCNMYISPGLPNFHLASDKTFLEGDKGVFGKIVDNLDWIGTETPFPRLRLINRLSDMEVQLGYQDEFGRRRGLKSSVFGISLKDNPDKARGVRGPLIHYEEDGLFKNLEKAWNVNRKAVEDGDNVFGVLAAAGTGGCLTADNKVFTHNGDLVKISELNISDGIIGFDLENKTISKENITYWQPEVFKECIKITTNSGRWIECSHDHPIYSSNTTDYNEVRLFNWNTANSLKLNDLIAVAEDIDLFGESNIWNPRLIGLLIGDGSYGERQSPNITSCDPGVINFVKSNFDTKVYEIRPTSDGGTYENIGIKKIRNNLRELGIYGQTGLNKRLPRDIFKSSKNDVCELIGGLFDTDGCIMVKNNKKRNSFSGELCLTSSSNILLQEVQLLLQKLGIHGYIRFVKPRLNKSSKIKDVNGWYNLVIADKDSIIKFADNITLLVDYKQDRLTQVRNICNSKKSLRKDRGFRYEKIASIENTGNKRVYNLTANRTHTYLGNGIITHNTEGADFVGSEKLFRNPKAYNIYGIPNVFDKNSDGKTDCGFFWPAYLNRANCYDEHLGEPDVIKALLEVLRDRFLVKYNSSDPLAITQKKAEEPITPAEAVMKTSGTLFPVSDLKEYLGDIKMQGIKFHQHHYVGELVLSGGNIKWQIDNNKSPIRSYQVTGNNLEGAIEIFEMPKVGADKTPFRNRYIGGIDPVDDDQGTSLCSIFIFDLWTDTIVAEYTGRPKFADDFYEICRRLLMFYNAEGLYENNKKGLFSYFQTHGALYLLAENPSYLKDREMMKKGSYGNKAVGVHATKEINELARRLQRDWMLTTAHQDYQDINEEGNIISSKMNLQLIRSIGYIDEAVEWSIDGNFDRVSAMGMVMILREEKKRFLDTYKTQADPVKDTLNSEYFSKNYKSKGSRF